MFNITFRQCFFSWYNKRRYGAKSRSEIHQEKENTIALLVIPVENNPYTKLETRKKVLMSIHDTPELDLRKVAGITKVTSEGIFKNHADITARGIMNIYWTVYLCNFREYGWVDMTSARQKNAGIVEDASQLVICSR